MKMFQYAAAATVLAMGTSAFGAEAFLTDGGPSDSNAPTPSVNLDIADGTGSLYVMVDTSPEGFTFQSFAVKVTSSTSGVIGITGAEVFNPTFFGGFVQRWDDGGAVANSVSTDGIDELLGVAVQTSGLVAPGPADAGDPNVDTAGNFVFARFDFDILGVGSTELALSEIDRGTFIVDSGSDVADDVTLTGTTVNVVPEPATVGLLAMGGLLMVRRRRA